MSIKIVVFTLSTLYYFQALFGQTIDPLTYFPHGKGDIWEYNTPPTGYRQNVILSDSIGTDGVYYIETSMLGKLSVNPATFEVRGNVWGGPLYNNLLYKLDADSGESWPVSGRDKASVVNVFVSMIFGSIPIVVKEIDTYDSISGLLYTTDYLATSFGLIEQDQDAMPVYLIRGTRINGVQHGQITDGITYKYLPPSRFILEQNYPNPFNPTTLIRYQVNHEAHINLSIFTLDGKLISTLVDQYQLPGKYAAAFYGSDLSSGVYVYRLSTSAGDVLQKKMIRIK